MRVLSLFDGMSCGRVALSRANIKVKKYYSSEIYKYPISIADKNYPCDAKYRLGDVTKLKKKELKKLKIDLLIGGSPCQGFSMAGKLNGSSTITKIEVTSLKQYLKLKKKGVIFEGQSYLFWEFIRVLKICKPKYFLLENVRITKKWLPMFNDTLEVEPIFINSNLVSAQNRPRYYWTNIKMRRTPKDKGILLKDILEPIEFSNDVPNYLTQEFDGVSRLDKGIMGRDLNKKQPCLSAGSTHANKYVVLGSSDNLVYRKLEPIECERLQTLPDNYTKGVSNTQRYKMIGNGWTVDVVAHIFKGLKYNV